MKTAVKLNHPSLVVKDDIALTNQTAPFFSHHLNKYEIDKKQFPLLLRDLFCETNAELINFEKPHHKFIEEYYQFYTIKKELDNSANRHRDKNSFHFQVEEVNDSTYLFYFKDTIIDVSEIIPTALPSYFNFSELFFEYTGGYNYYNYRNSTNRKFWNDSLTIAFVQSHHKLLKNDDPIEIKKLLTDFLKLANKYEIPTNLKTEDWFTLIYNDSFLIKNLIKSTAPSPNDYSEYGYEDWDRKARGEEVNRFDKNGNKIKTARDEFIAKLRTNFYLESDKLRNTFYNIKDMKRKNPFEETIHFFMWFSFFLTSLIFVYRTSGLKSLIFSILFFGILGVLLGLIAMGYNFGFDEYFLKLETFMAIFTLIVGTIIIAIPIFYLKNTNKMISSICINISISCFAFYMFLIVGLISIFQDYQCDLKYETSELRRIHCENLIQSIDIYWSYILFTGAFIFIYYFTGIIRKWKSLPENK